MVGQHLQYDWMIQAVTLAAVFVMVHSSSFVPPVDGFQIDVPLHSVRIRSLTRSSIVKKLPSATVLAASSDVDPAELSKMEDVEEKRLKSLEMLPSTGGAGERTFDSGVRVRMGVVQNVDGGNNIYSEPVEISYGDGNEEASPEERQEKLSLIHI